MSLDFNTDEIMRKLTEMANQKIHAVLEEAKIELGEEGQLIHIEDRFSVMDTGDQMNIAGVTFPSEDVKDRFLALSEANSNDMRHLKDASDHSPIHDVCGSTGG